MQFTKTAKAALAVAATLAATAVGVTAAPNAAWADYEHPACSVYNPGLLQCDTQPGINPHMADRWLRYKLTPGTTAEIMISGGGIVRSNSQLIKDNQWHTEYGFNTGLKYKLRVHVALAGAGTGHLSNCTTLQNGKPCD